MITHQLLTIGLKQIPDYDNARCMKCKLCNGTHHPFVRPRMNGELMIVLPSPMPDDDTGTVGSSIEWEMITSILHNVGVKPHEYSFTTVIRCHPGKKRTITQNAIQMCSPFLFKELNKYPRGKLILFGAETLHALVNPGISMGNAAGLHFDTPFGRALVTYSIREYFRSIKGADADGVLNVGIIDVIQKHIEVFLREEMKLLPQYDNIKVLP